MQKSYTQAELLARALDTEEGNILEHRGYLEAEEEKRRRARVVRKGVEGPKLRWISHVEEERVREPVPQPAPLPVPQQQPGVLMLSPASGASYYPARNFASTSSSGPAPPPPRPPQGEYYYAPPPAALPPTPTIERTEKVCKNYVVHEIPPPPPVPGHAAPQAQKPSWEATMAALFGPDVPWAELKVFSGKNRPLCTSLDFWCSWQMLKLLQRALDKLVP